MAESLAVVVGENGSEVVVFPSVLDQELFSEPFGDV